MTAEGDDPSTPGRAAGALMHLYPKLWRERYGVELTDLLASSPMSIAGVVATLRGALDAHANLPDLLPSPTTRLRWSVSTTFAAWMAFCVAAAGVAKSSEDRFFAQAAQSHLALTLSQAVASVAFAAAALAVAYAGLPLAAAAVSQAYRRRDRVAFGLMAVPVAAVAAALTSGILIGQLHPGPVQSPGATTLAVGWFVFVLVGAAASVGAVAAVVHRTDFSSSLLRRASWMAVMAALAMSTGVLAGASYGLAVRFEAPTLFFSHDGLLATPLTATWLPALVVAAAAMIVADRAAWRALRTLKHSG